MKTPYVKTPRSGGEAPFSEQHKNPKATAPAASPRWPRPRVDGRAAIAQLESLFGDPPPAERGMSAAITCLTFKPLARGSMLGFADLQMPSGLILKGCSLLESNGRRWVNPPGRPQLDADRKAMLDDAGKIIYAVSIDFSTKAIRSRWSAEAVAAIDGYLIGIGGGHR